MRLHMPELPPAQIVAALRSYNLLPAIVFLPTRRRCDEAAVEVAMAPRSEAHERIEQRRALLSEFVEEHPEVRRHRHWNTIVKGGVASHHAGHLPPWKLIIERMMSGGLLDAIFATMTVAAGVDFPARTVVISHVDIRKGAGWQPLTASELQQMTGRAGRRGRDRVGFVVVAPGRHQDPDRILTLLDAPPDPLQSQFRATYSTLLNLLDAYESFGHVRDIAEKSFAFRETAKNISQLKRGQDKAEARLRERLKDAGPELSTSTARGLERLVSARARLLERLPQTRGEVWMSWLDDEVVPGRVVGIGRAGKRLALVTRRSGMNLSGLREDGRAASLSLDRIGRIYERVFSMNDDPKSMFDEVRAGNVSIMKEPKLSAARGVDDEALEIINNLIENVAPTPDEKGKNARATDILWSAIPDAESVERSERFIESLREKIWLPFEQRARVLAAFGYLDLTAERVTDRGRWLADLHVDRPLLVGEALGNGLFNNASPPLAAGLMAALAADIDRDYGEIEMDESLNHALAEFDEVAYVVSNEEWKQGIEPEPDMNFSAAAAAMHWASGIEWTELVRETRAEEGDLVRMLSRTGESLIQIGSLSKAQPDAARIASEAADLVLREPVR